MLWHLHWHLCFNMLSCVSKLFVTCSKIILRSLIIFSRSGCNLIILNIYLAIIEQGWVGYLEFCRYNTHGDLQNSWYPMKAKFSNCFIMYSKSLKGEKEPFAFLLIKNNTALSQTQVFLVNGSIICSGLHFWCSF